MIGVDSVLLREGAGGIGGFTKHVMGHSEKIIVCTWPYKVSSLRDGWGNGDVVFLNRKIKVDMRFRIFAV